MSEYVKIQAQAAKDLLNHFEFSEDDAANVVIHDEHPVGAINKLFDKKYYIDGVKVLAHALPKRESVWWACLAVRQSNISEGSDDDAALRAAEEWARQPTEENRQQCKLLSEKLGHKTAAAWAATAATWCTGSIADPDQPEVAPPEKLYAHAVAGAVSLAAVGDPAQAEALYDRFLQQGLNLASGGNGQL